MPFALHARRAPAGRSRRSRAARSSGVIERARRERAHAAGVRPAVVVEDPLVILRRRQRHERRRRRRARSTTPPRRRGTLRARCDRRRSPKRAIDHRRAHGGFGGRAILGDHDALAGREAVGLDDQRDSRTRRARSPSSAASAESQTRKRAVGTRWRAMKSFANALLDSSAAAALRRPDDRAPVAP